MNASSTDSGYVLAFSCSRRGFCPSCAAKRGAIFGALLREEVVEEVGYCLWTFTVPKLLDDGRIELLDSWKSGHARFSAHNAVTVQADDHTGLERLARLLMHIPAPRLHLVRYYGPYSHVSRARRGGATEPLPVSAPEADSLETGDAAEWATKSERKRLRRQWAQLLRRVYEADPLLCECGA